MADDRGTYRKYVDKTFTPARLQELERANAIIEEYEGQGYVLTLRQLYYQLVVRGFVENSKREYDRLGDLISDGRLAGIVSWTAIEDRGRPLQGLDNVSGPAEALHRTARSFRRDLWADQPMRPEVWVEKQALEGVVAAICNTLRVDFMSLRGYSSQSAQWRASRRFIRRLSQGQRPVVLHLGDHDPSGLDMTRDNADRLRMFVGVPVQVIRVALNWGQVQELQPPPNPAKLTDSRYAAYAAQYGDSSWELDALDPATISRLISDAVGRLRDEVRWSDALAREVEEREYITELANDLGPGGRDELED